MCFFRAKNLCFKYILMSKFDLWLLDPSLLYKTVKSDGKSDYHSNRETTAAIIMSKLQMKIHNYLCIIDHCSHKSNAQKKNLKCSLWILRLCKKMKLTKIWCVHRNIYFPLHFTAAWQVLITFQRDMGIYTMIKSEISWEKYENDKKSFKIYVSFVIGWQYAY